MIPRYSRPDMSGIWSDGNKYKIWLEVETLALEQMVKEGLAPREAYDKVKAKASFSVERVLEIEEKVKHDVIAFLTCLAEKVGPLSRYVHRGMTSSDLLDTTFAVQLRQSGTKILRGLDQVLEAVLNRAREYKTTPCIGRSHGIHAEPTTFGLKLISWYAELKRHRSRLEKAIEDISVCKISGAVGTYASLPPSVELHVANRLGLKPETVSSQIVQRDRHAAFFAALALLGSSVEKFCVEIRHLQRTEVGEVEEKFTKGQKGSSAMPHKKNPVLSENLTGLSRLLRGYALASMENVPLWHERDISHSSVERVIAPDACIVTDFMLWRFKGVVENMIVHTEKMLENINLTRGLIFSGTVLVRLVDEGMTREDAYLLVQKHAMATLDGGPSFEERIRKDKKIRGMLSGADIDEIFDLNRHLRHVDMIFDRALAAG